MSDKNFIGGLYMNEKTEQMQNNSVDKTEFKIGQIIHPVSNPSASGAIVGINLHPYMILRNMATHMLKNQTVIGGSNP